MASCDTCGGKAGMFAHECESCTNKRLRDQEERQRAARAAKAEQRQREINDNHSAIVNAVRNGEVRYIYDTAYVDIDSRFMNEELPLDVSNLVIAGWNGWRVETTFPRTFGMTLENKDGYGYVSFAGGLGGHVFGAYIVISMELNQGNIEERQSFLRENLEKYWSWN